MFFGAERQEYDYNRINCPGYFTITAPKCTALPTLILLNVVLYSPFLLCTLTFLRVAAYVRSRDFSPAYDERPVAL